MYIFRTMRKLIKKVKMENYYQSISLYCIVGIDN